MRTKKIINTQVDIIDMTLAYGGDIDLVVKQILEDIYVGKCHFGCLILSIIRIVNRGACRINSMASTGQAYCNVQFEADVLEYCKDEGFLAKIIEIDANGYIYAKTPNNDTTTIIQRKKTIKTVKVDDIIPIRVVSVSYTTKRPSISVNGTFYKVDPKESYIFKIEPLTQNEKDQLKDVLDEILGLEHSLDKCNKKTVKFFTELLYPFKKSGNIQGKANDMRELNASGYVTRSEYTNKAEPTIHVVKKTSDAQKQSALVVYQLFLNDYKLHILLLLELCIQFPDAKTRQSNNRVWEIYKSHKK